MVHLQVYMPSLDARLASLEHILMSSLADYRADGPAMVQGLRVWDAKHFD